MTLWPRGGRCTWAPRGQSGKLLALASNEGLGVIRCAGTRIYTTNFLLILSGFVKDSPCAFSSSESLVRRSSTSACVGNDLMVARNERAESTYANRRPIHRANGAAMARTSSLSNTVPVIPMLSRCVWRVRMVGMVGTSEPSIHRADVLGTKAKSEGGMF